MINSLKLLGVAAAALTLSGCFLSESALIGEGEKLQDGPLSFCLDAGAPCQQGVPEADGYLVLPYPEDTGEEEPIFVRFTSLTTVADTPVWLGEAELGEPGEPAWGYVVVRRAGMSEDGVTEYDVAAPGCSDASGSQRIRFGLEQDGAYACRVTRLDAFAEYLIERHGEDFADPGWWDTAR